MNEASAPPAMDSPPKVVVIDDTEGNRYAVARLLRGAGMRVAEAGTGTDGLKLAMDHPDLVLVDVNLPDMSGFDVVRALRADPVTASIPIVHISASFIGASDRAHGLEAGADAYITHPVEPIIFLATVRALLRASQAESTTRQAAWDWSATFDTIRDAIFVVEDDGTIRRCNQAAAGLLRCESDDSAGRLLDEALSDVGATQDERDALAAHLAAAPTRNAEIMINGRWYMATVDRLEQNGRVKPAIVCVLTDISGRKAIEQERESLLERADQARHMAEDANRSKSDFLAIASHELRTPLNAIAGFVQLLALGIRGPVNAAQLADLEKIRRSQVTLTGLINDLLSFARLERGTVRYDIGRIDVSGIMTGCAEMVEGLAHERHLAFRVETASEAPLMATADADKVQQILLNLLSNAFKFTPPGGSVTLSGSATALQLVIAVTDTGTGIPADKLDAIFDPFVQVDQRRVRAQEGIGLGLSISRELSRAMGGDLTVVSTLGHGSTFTLRLPRA